MRILGIDPGLAVAGLGLVQCDARRQVTAEDWLCITTAAGTPLPQRLLELSRDIEAYVLEHKPDIVVVERLFFATNKQTAIDVAQARGAILAAVAKHGIPVLEPTPLQMKQCVTGDGKADKRQVQDMVVRTLKLDEYPTPDDAADGLALALYGVFTQDLSALSHAGIAHIPAAHAGRGRGGKVGGRKERLAIAK
jgi:crossover junction endodeoxyribonuclease RuvC